MFAELEDHAAIGALPLEHGGSIVHGMGQNMDIGLAPRDELAVDPDPPVTVVEAARVGHFYPLGQAPAPRRAPAGRQSRRASAASSSARLLAAASIRSTSGWRPSGASSTARPCSVVPLGLATRLAMPALDSPVAASNAPVPAWVCSATAWARSGPTSCLSPARALSSASR